MSQLQQEAQRLEAAGLHVVPLGPRAKIPVHSNWQSHRPDAADVAAWWAKNPDSNVGMATGFASGVVVLDPDSPEALQWCRDNLPFTPWRVRTSRGEHLGYRATTKVGNRTAVGCTLPMQERKSGDHSQCHAGGAICKLDVRGDGGQVVMPPSVHPSGAVYQWAGAALPPLDTLPEWNPDWIPAAKSGSRPAPAPRDTSPATGGATPRPGGDAVTRAAAWLAKRDPACFGTGTGDTHYWATVARVVRDFGLGDGPDARRLLLEFDARCQPPQGERFLDAKIRTAMRNGQNGFGSIEDRPLESSNRPDNSAWADRRTSRADDGDEDEDDGDDDGFVDGDGDDAQDMPAEILTMRGRVNFPHINSKGKPIKSFPENTYALLDAFDVRVMYNKMTHNMELQGTMRGVNYSSERSENTSLTWVLSLAERFGLSKPSVMDHLVWMQRDYHPVYDWITSRPWDGVDRIGAFMDHIKLAPEAHPELCYTMITRWMLASAACIHPEHDRRVRHQGVWVLQGPQGINKTRFIESLAPVELDCIRTGASIDPHNKDSLMALISYWIAELGEVDGTFRRSDIAALKAFVTNNFDIYRAPYAKKAERVARRTSMIATVNSGEFLVDETGNRRWWVTPVIWMVPLGDDFDRQQLWAQVTAMVDAGERWWLDSDEIVALETANTRHQVTDILTQELWHTWRVAPVIDPENAPRFTLAEICRAMPAFANGRIPTQSETRKLAAALRTVDAENATLTKGNKTYRVLQVLDEAPVYQHQRKKRNWQD
jgi:hypothetical protein